MVLSSLETRWLKPDKGLPQPLVVHEINSARGGCYYQPWSGQVEIGGRFYDMRTGIIVISEGDSPERIPEIIAHEWRHHWQRFNSRRYYDYPTNCDVSFTWENYRAATVEYYTSSVCEMDALLYSLRKAPNDVNRLWFEWMLPFRPRPLKYH